jgi:hypothetical protein
VLRKRMEEEVERGTLVPENQGGFRKGRGTMDNVFVLSHLVQRERRAGGKARKVYAFFADLSSAFDNVDRKKLWEILERKNINSRIIERIKEIYRDTKAAIRTKEGLLEQFKTNKGVRQGCVLSPTLFNLYVAELDECLEKRGVGGLKLGKERVWVLAYADDLVLLAKNREAMLDMMRTLEGFLRERNLKLNSEKSKMMVFNKERRKKKMKWEWGRKEIEEVQIFKYLGFNFNRRGDYDYHIKELKR